MNTTYIAVVIASLFMLNEEVAEDDKRQASDDSTHKIETVDAYLDKSGNLIVEYEVSVSVTVATAVREGDATRIVTEERMQKVKRASAHPKGSFRMLDAKGKEIGPMGVEGQLKKIRKVFLFRDGELPDDKLLKSLDKDAVILVLEKPKAAPTKQ